MNHLNGVVALVLEFLFALCNFRFLVVDSYSILELILFFSLFCPQIEVLPKEQGMPICRILCLVFGRLVSLGHVTYV